MILPKTVKPSRADERDAYELVTLRDDNTCQRCRRDCGPVQRDHRQNRMPGNTVAANLQCLGLRCHQWKTEHPAEAFTEGWACPSWVNPREWPGRRYVRDRFGAVRLSWVLYGDDGSVTPISDGEARRLMEAMG